MSNKQNLSLIPTKQLNMPSIEATIDGRRFSIYSKYNPLRDSKIFANENYDQDADDYLIYGLGLGYHINELEDLIKANKRDYHIYVIEFNKDLVELAKKSINLSRILNNENISFVMLKDDKESYKKLNSIISIENIKIVIHKPSLNIIPEKFKKMKYLLEEFIMKQNTIALSSNNLDGNFHININNFDMNVDVLFGKYKDKPLYLIAAGPSLDKNIQELSRVKDNGIILSVGRAVKPLLGSGIMPDYIIITDPAPHLYNSQLKGLEIDVPIIVLSTCDKSVMLNYKGEKYIALQDGYSPAQEYAKTNNNILVETGGSVATTGLDVAIRMGCNPIIFVGQDLGFTDNKSHSSKTYSRNIIETNNLRDIEDINGNIIQTSKNLYIYLRWIQNRIAEAEGIEFIDASEGGAKIEGTKIMKLRDIAK